MEEFLYLDSKNGSALGSQLSATEGAPTLACSDLWVRKADLCEKRHETPRNWFSKLGVDLNGLCDLELAI